MALRIVSIVAAVLVAAPSSAQPADPVGPSSAPEDASTPAVAPAPASAADPPAPASSPAVAPVPASPPAAQPEAGPEILAVLDLEANTGAEEQAPAVSALLASHLAGSARLKVISQTDIKTALGLERERQLTAESCSENSACLVELSGAVGARFVVHGRVDRFGQKFLLSASLFDAQKGESLAKPTAEAGRDDELPGAARSVADALLARFGDALVTSGSGSSIGVAGALDKEVGRFSLGLKMGPTFFANLRRLSPGGDLDLALQLDKEWTVFVVVGFNFLQTDASSKLSIVPSVIGARHYHFVEQPWQPYWGVGLGVQLSLGTYGIFQNVGSFPSVLALGGLRYRFNRHFYALLEANTNLAQTVIQFTQSQLDGFNLDLNLGVTYVF